MRMMLALLFCFVLLFASCGTPDSVRELENTNAALQAKNDSLIHVIEQLQQAPDDIIRSAKKLMIAGEKDSVLMMLNNPTKRSLTQKNVSEIARLLKQPKRKVKEQKKQSLAVTPADASTKYIDTDKPVDNESRLVNDDAVQSNWSDKKPTTTYKRPAQEKTYAVRTGAICRDGTRSSATGRGACSHHGGVREWVYE